MTNAARLIAEAAAQVAAGAKRVDVGFEPVRASRYSVRSESGEGFVEVDGVRTLTLPLSRDERAELDAYIDGPDGFADDDEH